MTDEGARPRGDEPQGPGQGFEHGRQANSTVQLAPERPLSRRTIIGQSHWFMSGTPEQRRAFARAAASGRQTAEHNRRLVLAHQDLAAQLVYRLGYKRPDQWNGYIPPKYCEVGGNYRESWHLNDSPVRKVLRELVAEALRREVLPAQDEEAG